MKRIGIIGTENSHALEFAKLINLPNHSTGRLNYESSRVVGIFGTDKESVQEIMEKARVEHSLEKPEDFFGKVDAMMVTSRRGSEHYKYAMPFIERGIPIFIDKPFTSDYQESIKLIEEAQKRKVPVCGGSGCKYLTDVRNLQKSVNELISKGRFITACANFSVEMDSIYDGFFFYAPHLTEIVLTIFGYDVKSVGAYEKNGSVIAVARYADFDVTLNYTKNSGAASCVLFTTENNVYRAIELENLYENELDVFFRMLETGRMELGYDKLIKPVAMMEAIMESLKKGTEVPVR